MKTVLFLIDNYKKQIILWICSLCLVLQSNAQCPTIDTAVQNFCDIESILVSDLEAIDNGGGVVWYDTLTSTNPLNSADGLINGEDYYATDSTGICAQRQRVDVVITGPPLGQNFQGICLDDPNEARISDLVAMGNDVQWYNNPSGGGALPNNASLVDNKIYYADQANPVTGCRSSRLSVLVNVGNIPIPTGDPLQEFCYTSDPPTVGDLVASGQNNWYTSISSAVVLDASTPLVNGASYYATTVDPPCESDERLRVTVQIESISPGLDASLDICENDPAVDLFSVLGGTPTPGGTWLPALNSGTGVFDPNIDASGVYTYAISGSICSEETSQVTVTVDTAPDAGSDSSLELCEDETISFDLFEELNGTPEIGGSWSPSLTSGSGIFDPTVDQAGTYTYTVDGGSCGIATANVVISITELPDAGTDGSLDLCSTDTLNVDLFSLLGGNPDSNGTWSPALSSGTSLFDPTIDSQGIYTYLVSGNGICPDDSATVTVTIALEPNAGTDGSLAICSTETTTTDLFNLLGGTPDTGGQWTPALTSGSGLFDPTLDSAGTYTYTVSGNGICPDASATIIVSLQEQQSAGSDGSLSLCSTESSTIDLFDSLEGTPDIGGVWTPALTSGTGIFDPTIDSQGTYTYSISGNGTCNDTSASVLVTIENEPNAGTDSSIDICSNDTSTTDLFSLLGGTPDTGGFWSPALNSGTGVFDPVLDSEGTYVYTVDGNSTCPDASASVTVIFVPNPDAGSDGNLNSCSDDTTSVDLFTLLGGTPDSGGTWSPALNSGTGLFDPTIDAAGVYSYTVLGSSGCPDASASVTVTISEQPNAGANGSIDICENDTDVVDLFTLLVGTPDSGGVWSPALASGTGLFDPTIDPQGTYTYTISSNSSCPDASASVDVAILQQPNAGSDSTISLCETDPTTTDLFTLIGDSPDSGGTWSPALASGSGVFDPAVDPEGIYTYTVSGTSGCPDSSSSVEVTIRSSPNAGTDSSLNICENDTDTIDLFMLLGGNPDVDGSWSPSLNSGTGVFDPSIDVAGVYTYTVESTTSCPDASATVSISLVEQLNPGEDGVLEICQTDTNSVDLFTILNGTPDTGGTWSPALSSGSGIFDPAIDQEGIYTYGFSGSSGCPDTSASITVSFIQQPDAGSNGSIAICANDTNQIDLFNLLGGTPDSGGQWTPALNGGNGIYDPSVDEPGVYTYEFSNGPCANVSATVTVSITATPNAGVDSSVTLCITDVQTVNLFDYLGPDAQTGGTWMPTLQSGTGIFDLDIDSPGVYTYQVGPDACGLIDNAKVEIVVFTAPDVTGFLIEEDTTLCLSNDLTLTITDANQLSDGDYTLNYQIDGVNNGSNFIIVNISGGTGTFTVPADELTEIGVSELSIIGFYFPDGSCNSDTSSINKIEITIEDALPPTLIDEGQVFCDMDDASIADLNERINEDSEITWYDAASEGNEIGSDTPLVDATTYYASQVGENGCESTVRLAVTVSIIECLNELIIPDGFSPNDDGVNDDFHIVNLNELYPNFRLKIFNRYGNILYEADRLTPRWDGTSNRGNTLGDSKVPTGVYFYILDFNDGERKAIQGRVYLNR